MALSFTKLIVLSILCFTTIPPIEGKQQVPCLFFMGDSQTDNGNNNFLSTQAKVNYLPYGIDYPDGPTGRFSNGRNVPDFLAEFLGFEKPIPPFATAKGREILKGVNYASGGAGILDDTGRALGDRISLNMQLRNHHTTAFKIALLLGNATLARYRLNKCLYIVNMGNNDYLNNYLQPKYYRTSTLYTPEEYAELLIKQYSMQLRTLHEYGARKIVVYEVATLGCLPEVLSITNPTNGSSCDDSINNAMQLFNNGLKTLIDTLNTNITDAQFILINATSISLVNYTALGIKVGNAPCCLVSDHPGGLCDPGKDPCSNRNEYAFWDNYHTSEVVNRATAARAYNATLPTDAYPFDIRRLVQN